MTAIPLTLLVLSAAALKSGAGQAAEAPYFQGKTITILEARAAGGTGSIRTQTAAKYLSKYVPGNPAIVYQFMPGGGGALAMNHVTGVARKDGLTIGNVSSAVFAGLLTGAPGFRFKLEDIRWLGTATSGTPTALVIRPGMGIDTVEKLRAYKGLRFANRSVGHSMYVRDRLTSFILELKEPRWILGYSDAEIRLALERAEADAQFGGIAGHVREAPEWFKEKGFTVPIILKNGRGEGAEGHPSFPQGRPDVGQFADTELKKAILAIYHTTNSGSVFFIPKDIPESALKTLNEAFNRVWKDPDFARELEELTKEPAAPLSGDDLHAMLAQVPKDPKIIDVYKQLIGGGPVPPGK
jgi:tripartite-type tricarboxylate transporter receptor subunit TctC